MLFRGVLNKEDNFASSALLQRSVIVKNERDRWFV